MVSLHRHNRLWFLALVAAVALTGYSSPNKGSFSFVQPTAAAAHGQSEPETKSLQDQGEPRRRPLVLQTDAVQRKRMIEAAAQCGLGHEVALAIWAAEKRYNLPEGLLLAVIRHESKCDPNAKNLNLDGTIDYGLSQVNSDYWPWFAQEAGLVDPDPLDPFDNIVMAAWYLAWLYDLYGDTIAVLTAYNRGPSGLEVLLAETDGVPDTDYSRAVLVHWREIRSGAAWTGA